MNRPNLQRRRLLQMLGLAGASALAGPALTACSSGAEADGRLGLWTHNAGNPLEMEVIDAIIADFNKSQEDYSVRTESFPQDAYNDAVNAGALAGDLPDVLDVDGPNTPNWAWSGHLQELPLDSKSINRLLPSCVGRFQDKVYSFGLYEAAVCLFARESVLERHRIRVPSMDDPWSGEEFDEILEKLGRDSGYEFAIDLGVGDKGEWFPYAFSPFLQSHGGDLIDREGYAGAEGVLNGTEAVAFGRWFQSLFARGLSNLESTGEREEFVQGASALAWNGNWAAVEAMETYDDVLFLPPPDFGRGPVTGGGSWQWAVSATSPETDGAKAYLETSLRPEYLAELSDRTGLIPATDEAAEMTENYGSDGRLRDIMEYSRSYARLRPETPAYPVISSVFLSAIDDVVHGGDVAETLDEAVGEIDNDIDSNGGYGF
ncbi:sugar ABC transporter substrate-binding protein [Salininema proteolyticum]|uniref:Extracellular solute-binding protein n=1 Tax=Salininema proteolyticum TaxID=1607685 RepID=A0ABV8U2J5_9ACTN